MSQQMNWKIFFSFAAIYIIWGSTYFALLIGVQTIPPFLLSATRFLAAGILLYAWCLWKREKQPDLSSLKRNAICGILMLFGGTVSVAWAEQYIPSSLAAIIVTGLPFWFVLLDKKQWPFYFSNKIILVGLLIGFAGVAILVGFDKSSHPFTGTSTMKTYGALAILCGGVAWTIGSLYAVYNPVKNSLLMNTSQQLLAAGLFCSVVSYLAGEHRSLHIQNISIRSWMALVYLVVMGSIIAYMSYLYLLKMRPAVQVSTYVYINPVIALLLGGIFAHETITFMQVIALFIILSGVLLVNMPKYKTLFSRPKFK